MRIFLMALFISSPLAADVLRVSYTDGGIAYSLEWDKSKSTVKVEIADGKSGHVLSRATGETLEPPYQSNFSIPGDVNGNLGIFYFKLKSPLQLSIDGKDVLIHWITDEHRREGLATYFYDTLLWTVSQDGSARARLSFSRDNP